MGELRARLLALQQAESGPYTPRGRHAISQTAQPAEVEARLRAPLLTDRELVEVHQRSILGRGAEEINVSRLAPDVSGEWASLTARSFNVDHRGSSFFSWT